MENIQPNTPVQPTTGEDEIDLIELAQKLWKKRKFILKACGIGVIVGLIVAFSIPKEYKTEVKLSPENAQGNRMGQLGSLAAMAGVNIGGGINRNDALSVELYPDIVRSTPFLLELIDIPVETKDGKIKTTLYEYMTNHQRNAWWSYITGAPFKLIGWGVSLFKGKAQTEDSDEINPFNLTVGQEGFVNSLQQKIAVTVDIKTGVLTGNVTMQDPLISAIVMDTVLTKLQAYITDYRTRKAKHDLAFVEELFNEAKDNYYKSQKAYALYIDENRNVISARSRTEEEYLRNEMNLTYGIYNQMAQQLEMNKVKVREQTPLFTVIEPAKTPLRHASPSRVVVLIGCILLMMMMSIGWLIGKNIYKR